jgi:hypothetical protein
MTKTRDVEQALFVQSRKEAADRCPATGWSRRPRPTRQTSAGDCGKEKLSAIRTSRKWCLATSMPL